MSGSITGIDAGINITETGWSDFGTLNVPYALGMANYKGYQQTTTEGVPLVYRCLITHRAVNEAGASITGTLTSDFASHIEFAGVQNAWPVKNAAVKWHAARKAMWKSTGVKRSHLGSYMDAVRYHLDTETTYLRPILGAAEGYAERPYTGGTWDWSEFAHDNDTLFRLKLLGDFLNEDTSQTTTYLNAVGSYLQSRINQQEDTNVEATPLPAHASMLEAVFSLDRGAPEAVMEAVKQDVQSQGDNPPYESFNSPTNTTHDLTEPVVLGRATSSIGAADGSVLIDIPFGLAKVACRATMQDDNVDNYKPIFDLKVTNIYEMQG